MIGDVIVGAICIAGLLCVAHWIDEDITVEGITQALLQPMVSTCVLAIFAALVVWAAWNLLTK